MARIVGLRLSLLFLCAAAIVPACLPAQSDAARQVDSSVFVDRSGSMKPYYESGLIDSIVQPLDRAASSQGRLSEFAFSTNVSRVRNLDELKSMSFGNFTYLDKVIEACERDHTPIAWIVTDNIEDTGEAGNTERFYAKLHSSDVLRVTVFPVLAPAGGPGLIIYALLFSARNNDAYDSMLEAFRSNAQGVIRTNALRMKPVDRDTVEVTTRRTNALTRRGNEKVYATGVPIKQTIEVRFKSKFDHIQIVDSSLRVLEAEPAFQPGSVLVPERRVIGITPDRVRALGPGDETAQLYLLTLDLGKVELKRTPAALWKAAWSKPVEAEELNLQFEIDVPRQNFQLRPQFLHEYSASTLEEARSTGKVYAIDRLLSRVNGDLTRIRVNSPLFFKMQYPTWPAVLWLGLFAMGLAILGILFFLGRRMIPVRQKSWEVMAEAPGGYPLAAKIEARRVMVEGEAIGLLEKNDLVPTGTTQLEKGAQRIPLVHGIRVPVRTRRSEMELIFNEVRVPNEAQSTGALGRPTRGNDSPPTRPGDGTSNSRPPATGGGRDGPASPPRRR